MKFINLLIKSGSLSTDDLSSLIDHQDADVITLYDTVDLPETAIKTFNRLQRLFPNNSGFLCPRSTAAFGVLTKKDAIDSPTLESHTTQAVTIAIFTI